MNSAAEKWKFSDSPLLASFDATTLLNAPFKVVLVESVKQELDEDGSLKEIVVPNPQALVKAVAQARALHPHKLNGAELKFLRTAMGIKAKDLAKAVALTPEHYSRCESDKTVLSPQSEMLIRVFTYVTTLSFSGSKKDVAVVAEKIRDVFVAFNIRACRLVGDDVVVYLTLSRDESCNIDDEGSWDESPDVKAA